jgi:type I restriction enzyme, S subunit
MTGLPADWRVVLLGDVADTTLGKMLDRGKSRGLPNVPYLRNVNVQWGRIDMHDLLAMELADEDRERFAVQPGDLLVCEGGEIGRAAIWHGRTEYLAFQKALHRIRSRGNLDMSYLRYLLEFYDGDGTLEKFSTGSTIAHLPQQKLRTLPVPLPPMEEQRQIVDILEDHLSRLDAAGQLLAGAQRRSDLLRAVTLESLAPEGTPLQTLGELATDSGYGTSTKCVVGGPGVPVVRIPNLSGGRVDLADEKRVAGTSVDLKRLMLEQGDLLIVRTNGSRDLIGRAAVVQPGVSASFASYLIRFRLDRLHVRPEWVRLMLGTPSVRRVLEAMAASSAGQYNLGLKKLKGVTIPCPTTEDQDRLLARVDEQEWALESLTRSLADGKAKAQSLRRSLLAAAFSGGLNGQSNDVEMVEEMAGV